MQGIEGELLGKGEVFTSFTMREKIKIFLHDDLIMIALCH